MELTHSQLGQQLLKLCKDGCTAEVGVFKSLLDQGADPNIHDEYPGYFPLWCASRYGKRDLVELFLQYKADINLKTKDYFARGETVLHAACKHGHVDVASSLLQHGAVVDNKDMDGQTALHRASNSGHTDVVKLLVDCGAQIDNKDKDGWTALDLASNKHYTDVVKALLASGAHHGIEYLGQQLLKLCKDGCTAKVGVFKSLLDQGVDPKIQDDKNDSHPLWYASRYGKRDLVELFLQYKADVNLKTINFFERGKTALHAACKHGHVNVATLLLHHGAVVDSQDWDGQTALHLASSSGHTAVVKLLVNSGAQLDNTDKDGQTALHLASSSGHTDVVKLLVDSGAQIDNKDKDGWTALDLASNNDHTDVVKVLLTSGAQHGVKYLGQQLLKLCKDCCTAEIGVFKSLLDQGVDPNIQEDGQTALHLASSRGHTDVVKLLVDSGAQIDNKDKDGQTALHLASSRGHTDVVKLLVDSCAQINNKDKDGWTALDLASNNDHSDVVKVLLASGAQHGIKYLGQQLLKLCEDGCTAEVGDFKSILDQGSNPNMHDEDGYHPLWYASRYGKRDLVELFLQYKADVNLETKGFYGGALHAACEHGHKDVASSLLHHGAVVDRQDKIGQTALRLASRSGHTDVVKLLVDSGAQIDNKDKDGWTALDLASNEHHTDVVKVLLASGAHHGMKYLSQQLLKLCEDGCTAEVGVFKSLLDQGADPNMHDDEDGLHPLWYASRYGKRDLVELFLQYKADANLMTKSELMQRRETALHTACKHGYVHVTSLLLKHGAVVDSQTSYGQTALHLASSRGHADVVKLLVDSGAQIDIKDENGHTALHLASRSGHTDVVELLLVDSGAQIDNKDKSIPLLKLCKDGCTAEVGVFKSLLDQGADPNMHDEDGLHPLWYASRYGKRDLVELFLQYKADVNLKTKGFFGGGETALHAACEHGHKDVASSLLHHGAVVDSQDQYEGETALHTACKHGYVHLASLLLKHGAVVDSQDKEGWTALHYASHGGHTDVVKLLVDSGSQIENKNKDGWTALHYASNSGHTDVVKQLVDSGAQIDNKDEDGETALHLASSSGHTDVVKLLIDSGAQIDNKDKFGLTPLNRAKREGHSEIVSVLEKALTRSSKPSSIGDDETEADKPSGLKGVIVCAETHVTVTNDAQSFTWKGYGLKLDIKEKSLPKDTEEITIHIKASITGDYDIQEGYERVSPVFWFCCDPMCKLEKEVTLEIQHCVMLECACDLTFARGDCSQKMRPYTFELLKGGQFSNQRPYGIIELNGFSRFTLLFKKKKNENTIWYFAQLFYSKGGTQKIHLAITKNSDSYITVLHKYYEKLMMDHGPSKGFQFKDNSITVTLQECEDGWELSSDTSSKITKREVDGCCVSPSYQLTAIVKDKTRPLRRKLSLNGATEPPSELYFIIHCEPATEQNDSPQPHSAEGSKRAAQPEEMIHELGETPKEPTLKELTKRLDGCVAKWRSIGVQLEFEKGDLDDIEKIDPTDNRRRLEELMGRWLDRGDASWSNLVEALETCRVNKKIIDSIKNDYCLKCRQ